jgi:hypothetical protein
MARHIFDVFGGAVGAAKRSSWAWLQTGVALGQVALHEGDHPPPGDPVLAGNLTFIASFDQHGRDHQLRHSDRSTLVVGCKRCPKTAVNDVMNSDTEVIALRKELERDGREAGAATIAFHLQQRHGVSPAVSTIWRILSATGFVTPPTTQAPQKQLHPLPGTSG